MEPAHNLDHLLAHDDAPLSRDDAIGLLAAIGDYCRRCKMSESQFGTLAVDFPGFAGLFRKRLKVRGRMALAAQWFMERYPVGVADAESVLVHASTRSLMQGYRDARDKPQPRKISRAEQIRATAEARRKRIERTPAPTPPPISVPSMREFAPVTNREPCFRCGVRRDIGCRHHPKEG